MADKEHNNNKRRFRSFLIDFLVLLIPCIVIARALIMVIVPRLASLTNQILTSVKEGWESLNIVLVCLAFVCGYLTKNIQESTRTNPSHTSQINENNTFTDVYGNELPDYRTSDHNYESKYDFLSSEASSSYAQDLLQEQPGKKQKAKKVRTNKGAAKNQYIIGGDHTNDVIEKNLKKGKQVLENLPDDEVFEIEDLEPHPSPSYASRNNEYNNTRPSSYSRPSLPIEIDSQNASSSFSVSPIWIPEPPPLPPFKISPPKFPEQDGFVRVKSYSSSADSDGSLLSSLSSVNKKADRFIIGEKKRLMMEQINSLEEKREAARRRLILSMQRPSSSGPNTVKGDEAGAGPGQI